MPRTPINSGCSTSDGRVECSPESMRAKAEAWLHEIGWAKPLSLATYTLARNAASERRDGTPAEKMGVIWCAINRARMRRRIADPPYGDVNELLLYQGNRSGSYGPIHLIVNGVRTAPYARWASTSKDPTFLDIVLADFAVRGGAEGYIRGGDDQIGARYFAFGELKSGVLNKAKKRNYWIGQVPGINPMEVFITASYPQTSPDSSEGLRLTRAALDLFDDPRTRAWVAAVKAGYPQPTNVPWAVGSDFVPGTLVLTGALAAAVGIARSRFYFPA